LFSAPPHLPRLFPAGCRVYPLTITLSSVSISSHSHLWAHGISFRKERRRVCLCIFVAPFAGSERGSLTSTCATSYIGERIQVFLIYTANYDHPGKNSMRNCTGFWLFGRGRGKEKETETRIFVSYSSPSPPPSSIDRHTVPYLYVLVLVLVNSVETSQCRPNRHPIIAVLASEAFSSLDTSSFIPCSASGLHRQIPMAQEASAVVSPLLQKTIHLSTA
jgi:hypothetical protein